MPIDFQCDGCGKRFTVKDEMAGKKGKCTACGSPVKIPILVTPPFLPEEDEEYQIPDQALKRLGSMVDLLSEADPELRESDVIEEPAPPPRDAVRRLYVYKMVQIPQNIQVMEGTSTTGRAAAYLEEVVNHHAMDGWDFHRTDEIGILVTPGCLTALFGGSAQRISYTIITFRRPIGS